MYCLTPLVENIAGSRSLRIGYDDFVCDTKTKDNVFVKVVVNGKLRVISILTIGAHFLPLQFSIKLWKTKFQVLITS